MGSTSPLGDKDRIVRMVEYKDANPAERAVRLCNSGMMAARKAELMRLAETDGLPPAATTTTETV